MSILEESIVAKKEALLLINIFNEAVKTYVVASVNKVSTATASIEMPSIHTIADIITNN